MENSSGKYSQLFLSLTDAIQAFIVEVKNQKLQNMATDTWTVKDVLCHIAYWHTYYAQNYQSLAAGTKPFVFTSKGGSTRNQEGVDTLRHLSREELITVITNAQDSLYKSIVIKQVPKMNYTDRKEYRTDEFLEIVTHHINRHALQVKRAK